MKHLLLDIENKFLIDEETGEILAERGWDLNKTLRDFDRQGITYTIQILF